MYLAINKNLWVDVIFVKDIEVLVKTFLILKGEQNAPLMLASIELKLTEKQDLFVLVV